MGCSAVPCHFARRLPFQVHPRLNKSRSPGRRLARLARSRLFQARVFAVPAFVSVPRLQSTKKILGVVGATTSTTVSVIASGVPAVPVADEPVYGVPTRR